MEKEKSVLRTGLLQDYEVENNRIASTSEDVHLQIINDTSVAEREHDDDFNSVEDDAIFKEKAMLNADTTKMSLNLVYRGDVDGLRALAVTLVVLYHVHKEWIPSGFIGVDIFFVISGFLISTGVQAAIVEDRFSFAPFYSRRLWRLQPLCLVVVAATLIYTTLKYPPSDYLKFTDSLYWAAGFAANLFYSGLEVGYMSENTAVMPLLHFWSLSVEWQWYLCLPMLLWILHRLEGYTRITTAFSFSAITLGAVAVLIFLPTSGPPRYYSFPGRIFEMCMGGAVGVSMSPRFIANASPKFIGTAKASSLTALVMTAFLPGLDKNYPNAWTIFVCFLASSCIYLRVEDESN